ncbi:M48 family metallopeptidase [Altererythrobacter sp. H2]|uniref:M48 family metallopeptidase n=1 Tax=Altererythrobacter sp. H2 TaxID=3108391 RepID=UPI002B4BF63C|nr:M48 family metallopeptidase [Altererythrobacter sp. H2]WRK95427.1 M48 family metallopeptidase [Altererythrobacter sp. H2]
MMDWLRRASITRPADPVVDLSGRTLPVAIRRHPRARRMTMRLARDGSSVHVTIPQWGRSEDALAFAHSRRDWLELQLGRCREPAVVDPASDILFRGEAVQIDWSSGHRRNPQLCGDALRCGGPQSHLQPRVQRWLERQALEMMSTDLALYCDRAGLAPPELRLSRAQRRWGSCSSTGTVRINWRLIQAPDFVRQSVVAHEVAHLIHFDHSPQFHRLLADLFGERLREADNWLKREGRTLYARFG